MLIKLLFTDLTRRYFNFLIHAISDLYLDYFVTHLIVDS